MKTRVLLFGLVGIIGCKDLTGSPGLPAGTPNPLIYNTPTGALGMRNAAVFEFEQAVSQYIIDAGLITDELEDHLTGASVGVLSEAQGVQDPLDERVLPEGSATSPISSGGSLSYNDLQGMREFGNQALGALAAYDTISADTATSKVLRGELYALEGFDEIMLADLFCSGVPLSTLDYQKDFTYQPSSTTTQVYQAAIAKFDTSLMLADTSVQVLNLARVGRGRAFVDLGWFDSAAVAVASVPNGFQYQVAVKWGQSGPINNILNTTATVSDREGGNGLDFLSSGDPRTTVETIVPADPAQGGPFIPLTFPTKYSTALSGSGYTFVTIADGIEAQLILAEAQLQPVKAPSGPWLATLNRLRESIGLSDTTDPGIPTGRIALLFRERAFWLFLTGHRQGDLRRLVRQYGMVQDQVYPSGQYLAPGGAFYGTDVDAPVPDAEYVNPLFHGCIDRNA